MTATQLTDEQLNSYERDGFLIVRGLFEPDLIRLLSDSARADEAYQALAASRRDGEGGVSRLSLRYELPEDIYAGIARSEAIVSRMEQLMGEEVYHYHHKMMMKEPFVGGAWAWHQDYGYWYNAGFLSPDLASCMVAVDPATPENGCLQVIASSHRLGRIQHGGVGDQTGADQERVDAILARLEKVYVELDPGDGLFFHSNLLHRSDQNKSPNPRWALICCYIARSNEPAGGAPPVYQRLERWSTERIRRTGLRHLDSFQKRPATSA